MNFRFPIMPSGRPRSYWLLSLIAPIIFWTAPAASAGICSDDDYEFAEQELANLLDENFAQLLDIGSPTYWGPYDRDFDGSIDVTDPLNESIQEANEGYIETLIACNRKRDSLAGKMEKADIFPDYTFKPNLIPRIIRGNYNFHGIWRLSYGYQLERKNERWIVTVPIEMIWPGERHTDKVDLPWDLAVRLALDDPGKVCEDRIRNRDYPKDLDKIKTGRIKLENEDGVLVDFACRVPKDAIYQRSCELTEPVSCGESPPILDGGTPILLGQRTARNHLREYWREEIDKVWSRPGFEVRPIFVNCEKPRAGTRSSCDNVSEKQLAAWEKDGIVWRVHFNHRPNRKRTVYRRVFGRLNHFYTGENGNVVAHEIGHVMGLGDEYKGKDHEKDRDCASHYADAPENFIMCDASAGRQGAHPVYPWLITRRYAAGEPYQCTQDYHCDGGEICKKGPLGIGRNYCESACLTGNLRTGKDMKNYTVKKAECYTVGKN